MINIFKERILAAMKSGNVLEKNILRVTLAEIELAQNSSSQNSKPLTDEQIHKIIRKVIQSNVETMSYAACSSKDVLEQENQILLEFLPKLLTKEEILQKLNVDEIKAVVSAGQAVGLAMKQLKSLGCAVDGNDVKSVVESLRC